MAKYKSDINLFDCIFKDKTKKAVSLEKEIKKSLLVFGGVAAACLVVGGLAVMAQKAMLAVTEGSINNLNNTYDFEEIARKKAECEKLTADNQKIRDELANFENSPQFRTEIFGYIAAAQPPKLIINSMTFSGSTISLNCTGMEELTGANFASRLREESNVFSNVEYKGATADGEAAWSFDISLTLVDRAAMLEAENAAAEAGAETAAEGEETPAEGE